MTDIFHAKIINQLLRGYTEDQAGALALPNCPSYESSRFVEGLMSLNSYKSQNRPPLRLLRILIGRIPPTAFTPPTTTTTTNFYSGGPTIYWRPAGRRFKISSASGLARGAGAAAAYDTVEDGVSNRQLDAAIQDAVHTCPKRVVTGSK